MFPPLLVDPELPPAHRTVAILGRVMGLVVGRVGYELEVARGVVAGVPVHVVDMFPRVQISAQLILHHQPVEINTLGMLPRVGVVGYVGCNVVLVDGESQAIQVVRLEAA